MVPIVAEEGPQTKEFKLLLSKLDGCLTLTASPWTLCLQSPQSKVPRLIIDSPWEKGAGTGVVCRKLSVGFGGVLGPRM